MGETIANWQTFCEHAALSDVGLRRSNNQDSFAVALAGDESHWIARGHMFIVADGMGAHAAGELASKMACSSTPLTYQKLANRPAPDALHEAIVDANAHIHERGQGSSDFNGMGTTFSSLVLLPQGAIVGHVGDSRVYRLRGNTLQQLTFDHSLVWEMKAAGHFNGTDAPSFVPKNIITRSLGPHPTVKVDLEGPFPLEVGDTFLICSDGLSGPVTDEEIGLMLGALSPQQAVRSLIDLANLRGGPDNITAIVVRIAGRVQTSSAEPLPVNFKSRGKQRGSVHPGVWVALGISVLVTLLFAALANFIAAFVALVVAVIIGVVALLQQIGSDDADDGSTATMLGRGPHMSLDIAAKADALAGIAQVVEKLREAATEDGWELKWPEFNAFCERAQKAAASGNPRQAAAEYAQAMSFMVAELKRHRAQKAKDDSSVLE